MSGGNVRNFVISYAGRVGSTALIDTLKMLPNFIIPIFEEYDAWYVDEHELHSQINEDNITDLVDAMYLRHVHPGVSVGFKWRIWGSIDAVAKVLTRHDVVVFNMVRSDAFEFFSSLYLSDVVHREFNASQFMLKDAASEAERQQILFRYRMQTHPVDLEIFRSLFEEGLERERERIKQLAQLRKSGLEIVTVFYEDFAYKRYRFVNAVLSRLGHPTRRHMPEPGVRKVGLPYPSELFENRSEVIAQDWLQDAIYEWDRVVAPPWLKTLAV